MSKGTIIYIGGFELPDKNAAANRVMSNAKIFKALEYKVVFLGIDKKIQSNIDVNDTFKEINGFDSWCSPYPKKAGKWYNYLTDITRIVTVLEKYNDVKAVICYNLQSLPFIKLIKYCKCKNIRVIGDCTEWYTISGSQQNFFFKLIKASDSFIRMRIIQKKIDGLIVISRYLENFYSKYIDCIKIPPLVDLDEAKWAVKPLDEEHNNIKLVYSGTPGKHKDKLNYVIKALSVLEHNLKFSLKIIGLSKEEYLSMYPEQEDILKKLLGKIKFLGRISHLESIQHVKSSDYCIFYRENKRVNNAGFPTKFVESITCKTPVITTSTSDLSDYIVDGVNSHFLGFSEQDILLKLGDILRKNVQSVDITKGNIHRDLFDYHNYILCMENFLKKTINSVEK